MKGGDGMGYSVKWVVENLGITRDMLRYYEKKGLLPIDETRNPSNKYRDYSEEDIDRYGASSSSLALASRQKKYVPSARTGSIFTKQYLRRLKNWKNGEMKSLSTLDLQKP